MYALNDVNITFYWMEVCDICQRREELVGIDRPCESTVLLLAKCLVFSLGSAVNE
jgi:hypothetical protein